MKQTVVFDFDGVIHSYTSGWKGAEVIPDLPVHGIKEAVEEIRRDYKVVVVSTRCATEKGMEAVRNYLKENGIVVDEVMKEKPPAIVYIDDRAICFDGRPESLLAKINSFAPWYSTNDHTTLCAQCEYEKCKRNQIPCEKCVNRARDFFVPKGTAPREEFFLFTRVANNEKDGEK